MSSVVDRVIDENLTNNVSDSFDRWRFLNHQPRTPVDEHRYVPVTARLSILRENKAWFVKLHSHTIKAGKITIRFYLSLSSSN